MVPETELDEAGTYVRELSSLRGYPWLEEGRTALLRAFLDHFPSARAVRAAIDELLGGSESQCPTPPEIRALAAALAPSAEERLAALERQQAYCPECDNTGWLRQVRGEQIWEEYDARTRTYTARVEPLAGVGPCPACPLGRFRAAAAERRRAAVAPPLGRTG